MLTQSNPVVKGEKNEFSLVKSQLITLLTSLSAPARYLDADNWKMIKLNYKSEDGIQRRSARLFPSGLNMVGFFEPSVKAENIFEIDNLEVFDFDNGAFPVDRSSLTVSEFDIDMTPAPSENIILNRNFLDPMDFEAGEGWDSGVFEAGTGLVLLVDNEMYFSSFYQRPIGTQTPGQYKVRTYSSMGEQPLGHFELYLAGVANGGNDYIGSATSGSDEFGNYHEYNFTLTGNASSINIDVTATYSLNRLVLIKV